MGAFAVYHEKQVKELCALHALNNLFQDRECYNKMQLDEICRGLAPDDYINPHKSILGLGNYDINVIISALHMKDCEAIWFDKRKDPSCIDTSRIVGFILNVPSNYKVGFVRLPIQRRHWISIKKINGEYWNLDSKLDTPLLIGNEIQTMEYMRNQLQSNENQLFIVCTKEVEKDQLWLLPEFRRVRVL
ncbi:josephin-like protein [Malaya genurostris]|uniref:josephin-like protein n=1 Tax=Malaya genurostris TaxID=325434 RepID=UPI0026F3E9C5|nr:josephin-like protein [Malaya genurostris]XP_058458582.1 josephin-like protein [Malaya genurostris]